MLARIFILVIVPIIAFANDAIAQGMSCIYKPPFFQMDFGKGNIQDVNTNNLTHYNRVLSSCPTDGHYSFTSQINACFRGDWHTLTEDHTPGDQWGNMLVVNSAYNRGEFLAAKVKGFKSGTTYQFGAWLMNVCKPTDKCPFPLLPNLTIRLQTPGGKVVAQFLTGELSRRDVPHWTQHRAQFNVPPGETELNLILINNAPGGCGNDFALDDITFRECVKSNPAEVVKSKKVPPIVVKRQPPLKEKKIIRDTFQNQTRHFATFSKINQELPISKKPFQDQVQVNNNRMPMVLKERSNPLVKHIETVAGEIMLDLYDNGEIDGDTVSIYHNNTLIVAEQRLSQKPISFRILLDKTKPHHELIMVANNLGSIPPNTSLMIVTEKDKRHQVYISSTVQKNAKVVIDLKE